MDSKSGRDRSVSGEIEESELGSPQENERGTSQDASSGKPGRKKNPKCAILSLPDRAYVHLLTSTLPDSSQAARRDQNRIAQREFRLRKQQRIRDLEARVEILSGGKDEAVSEMRNILRDLMAENQVLRNLLRSLSSFIGDGAGGLLPKLGWSLQDFESFINRSETDTAWEGFQSRKQRGTAANPNTRKRTSEDDGLSSTAKKPRAPGERDEGGRPDSFPIIMPLNAVPSSSNIYSTTGRPSHENSLLSDLMRGPNGSPMFAGRPSSPASPQYGASSSQVPPSGSNYQPPYLAPLNMNVEGSMQPMSFVTNTAGSASVQQPRMQQQNLPPMDEGEGPDPKNEEAQKLISYHLDNYKRNSSYCLPASLRPTLVQRTVPHESVIDRIPHPELRDRLILLRGSFNLVDCIHDYALSVTVHGDDVLAHSNWEIGEKWLRQYGYLLEQNTLGICNRWRRERGQPELRLSELAPPESQAQAM
ncbi:hypothetical protein EW146_g8439 [Bondarzewia mesenterica]|uniref:BZIP domain-containing protein n=1 Tax=Bondarzewia mesenterica TaxID=1095465 RepID=A0A4S4LEF9_9AGAM|nr:hypothetical protein EW146_g8439 [Bondarzewia mesenterica]